MITVNFFGASVQSLSAALVYDSTADGNTPTDFDTSVYDDDSWFNGQDLIVPSGISLVRAIGQTVTSGTSTPFCTLSVNGSGTGRGSHLGQKNWVNAVSAPIAVSSGNVIQADTGGGGTKNLTGGTWLAAEELSPTTKCAIVTKSADQSYSASQTAALTFNTETVDTNGWHDNATNNTRLTVPSGVSRVRLTFSVYSTTQTDARVWITKNGTAIGPKLGKYFGTAVSAGSGILEVSPGDYFELIVQAIGSQTISSTSWFSIEEVPDYPRVYLQKVNSQSITGTEAIQFGSGSQIYATQGIHSTSTNNTRITIPSGFTRARFVAGVEPADTSGISKIWVRKNGSGTTPDKGLPGMDIEQTGGIDNVAAFGSWVNVTAGDYFELMFAPGASQTLPASAHTFFCVELDSGARPVFTSTPSISSNSGFTGVGDTLTLNPGTSTGGTRAVQWLADGVAISGATADTYILTSGELGANITCRVTVTNQYGSRTATTNSLGPVVTPAFATQTLTLSSGGDITLSDASNLEISQRTQ